MVSIDVFTVGRTDGRTVGGSVNQLAHVSLSHLQLLQRLEVCLYSEVTNTTVHYRW